MIEQLPKKIQSTIEWLRLQLPEDASLFLFGSQVKGNKTGSDYDIGIKCKTEIEWKKFCLIKNEAEERAWPYKIDLVDLKRAPKEFLEVVEKEAIEI